MSTTVDEDIRSLLARSAAEVDDALRRCLAGPEHTPLRLLEAMRYSIDAGGKRLRPILTLWCCELCGGDRSAAMPAALAVECVHTFSLIHDDLPALDNDDLRRGRPSSHRQFGEAAAILAGDALLALAFEIVSESDVKPRIAVAMIRELAGATGWRGMIGGEAADLEGETLPPDARLVQTIHSAKTARLIEAACRLGAFAAEATASQLDALGRFGHELGLAFQAADDLLDLTGTTEALGKPVRRDAVSGKQTYPRAVGMEASRRIAEEAVERAVAALTSFGDVSGKLVSLARFVVERDR